MYNASNDNTIKKIIYFLYRSSGCNSPIVIESDPVMDNDPVVDIDVSVHLSLCSQLFHVCLYF